VLQILFAFFESTIVCSVVADASLKYSSHIANAVSLVFMQIFFFLTVLYKTVALVVEACRILTKEIQVEYHSFYFTFDVGEYTAATHVAQPAATDGDLVFLTTILHRDTRFHFRIFI